MKIGRITIYTLIFGAFLIFANIIFETYHNFFNKTGENETIILSKIVKFDLPKECEFRAILPNEFAGGEKVLIEAKTECESMVIAVVGNSFANRKASKKFVKLASRETKSQEVVREGNSSNFNIHTTAILIERGDKVKISIENLNKKHV
jgi:hypothetical protein